MSNWNLATDPIQTRKCPCCGEPFKFATGFICDEDGDDLAIYFANLAAHKGQRAAMLHIGLLVDDEKGKEVKKNFVSLALVNQNGKIGMVVVTNQEPSERSMTREEALASSLLPLVFEVADFIVDNDEYIGPFVRAEDSKEATKST